MAEIVVVSGKGGTGKTTVTAAFAELAGNAVVLRSRRRHAGSAPDPRSRDRDLHRVLRRQSSRDRSRPLPGLRASAPDLCRFDAVVEDGATYAIDPMACEGCKVCVTFCSAGAIAFPRQHRGRTHHSRTRFGPLIHADLFPGEENSGLLGLAIEGPKPATWPAASAARLSSATARRVSDAR